MLNVKQIESWILDIGKINTEKGWIKEKLEIFDLTSNLHGYISKAFEYYRDNNELNEVWYEYKEIGRGVNLYGAKKIFINGVFVKGKPCGIPSELSDIVILALDMVGYYGWENEYLEELKENIDTISKKLFLEKNFISKISDMHHTVSQIYLFENTHYEKENAIFNLDYLIKQCFLTAEKYEIDLYDKINDNIAYNKTRPYRHVNKKV